MLGSRTMVELTEIFIEMLEEGRDWIDCEAYIREIVRNEYDGVVWAMVDSEDNTHDLEFDDFLIDIVDDVSMRAESYMQGC